MTVTYPDLTEPASSSIPLSELDNAIAAAIAYLRATNYDADGPAAPLAGEMWIDSDNDQLAVYLGGWIPFRGFGAGKPVIWCDDQPEEIRLLAPETGIVAGGYNMILPTGAGSASQAWRVASVDGNTLTLEWFTPTASSLALDGLTDVDAGSPTNGQVLAYNSGSGNWEPSSAAGGGATDLDGLTDVTITAAAVGEYLRHNGSAWVDSPIQAGDIPDLSGTYALAVHTHPLSALTQSSATTGQFVRWNGSAWVAVNITAGDLPAAYLPLAGGTVTGATTFDDDLVVGPDGSILFKEESGTNEITITGPATLDESYGWSLPVGKYQSASEYNPTGGVITAGGLAVMAVNQTTGEAVWIGVEEGTGGRFLLNGADEPAPASGSCGEIRGAVLTTPTIETWVAAHHTHDGSAGLAGMGGDGSNQLDLFYAVDHAGGPLIPLLGGTGRTSIAAGALLLGGAASVAIPEKAFATPNGGETYEPMVQLLGDTDGAALVWDGTAGTWAQGPVPTAIELDSPAAGDLVYFDGSDFVHGKSLPERIRFLDSIECGADGGAPGVAGSIRLYQPPGVGSRHMTIVAPSAPVDNLSMTLPAQGGLVGDCLITTTAGDSMVLALGSPSRVDGVLFNLDGLSGGALLAYDGMEMIPFAAGLQGQVLTGGGAGSIGWSYPPGRTFTQSVSLGAVGPIESGSISRCVLVRAHVQLTITRVDVRIAGTSTPSITFQLAENGSGNVFSTPQAPGAGVTAYTSFADATIIAGSYLLLVISEVDGNVDDATVTVTFQQ